MEFTQTVDGVPIVDSSLRRISTTTAACMAITGGLVPDPTLESTDPDVLRDEALDAAADGVAGSGDAIRRPTLVAYTSGDELRLAWRVLVERILHGPLRHAGGRRDRRGGAPRQPREVRGPGAQRLRQLPGAATGGTPGTTHVAHALPRRRARTG